MGHVLAVTGSIASGKSSLCEKLADLGATTISADHVAHQVLQKETIVKRLISAFGEQITSAEGALNPASLADQAFASPEALRRLTDVVYPAIRVELREEIDQHQAAGKAFVVLEAPTLFEAECEGLVDTVVTVEAPFDERQRRCTQDRGWAPEELARREVHLLSDQERRHRADRVIENNEGTAALLDAAVLLYRQYTKHDSEHSPT
ncbi:MAG: dephospho-CoA kinase [Planctomycetota bacterium]